jgi:hypothetical protein
MTAKWTRCPRCGALARQRRTTSRPPYSIEIFSSGTRRQLLLCATEGWLILNEDLTWVKTLRGGQRGAAGGPKP